MATMSPPPPSNSQRVAMGSVAVFLLAGLVLLLFVNEAGIQAAQQAGD